MDREKTEIERVRRRLFARQTLSRSKDVAKLEKVCNNTKWIAMKREDFSAKVHFLEILHQLTTRGAFLSYHH
jgi:hypothetical protein